MSSRFITTRDIVIPARTELTSPPKASTRWGKDYEALVEITPDHTAYLSIDLNEAIDSGLVEQEYDMPADSQPQDKYKDERSELVAHLRDWCNDWDGSPMPDAAATRFDITCGTIREVIAALTPSEQGSGLREALEEARTVIAAVPYSEHAARQGEGYEEVYNRINGLLAKIDDALSIGGFERS